MVTILNRRRHGFDVVIYTNDHGPAHVHVFRGRNKLKAELQPVRIVYSRGFNSRARRRIRALLEEHHTLLLREWTRLHVK
ncbi:MAG: DUF4160 domain-containing protein [Chloroflexota bacterium]|nr:DUF4160 domain-containing protein [Chloroflexota bacterium]